MAHVSGERSRGTGVTILVESLGRYPRTL